MKYGETIPLCFAVAIPMKYGWVHENQPADV